MTAANFEFGPTVYIDELPEPLARLIFGNAVYEAWRFRSPSYQHGYYHVVDVDRDLKTVTVKFVES